jgi:hypothetical protein
MNASELMHFKRIHHEAVGFMEVATNDYVACHCCLLNGLFPGLRLGAEAVEKYLKAFVLYAEPAHNVRKYVHGIKDVAAATSKLKPGFNPLQQFSQLIDRLETHYPSTGFADLRLAADFGRTQVSDLRILLLRILSMDSAIASL